MKQGKAIYYKAFFLLFVFSLNTVVSFACSLSSYFHSFHHSSFAYASDRDHGKHGNTYHHDHDCHSVPQQNLPDNEKKDDCCSKYVVEFQKIEKSVSKSIEAPGFLITTTFLPSTYFDLEIPASKNIPAFPNYDRWRIPATIQDLRIIIQSFQI